MSLVVTGTIGIDTVYTPHEGHRENVLGGSCSYFAAAASFYGPVRMVAAVGDDFPDDHRQTFARFPQIDLTGLETRKGSKTFRWGGKYLDNMDHRETLFTELNVLEAPPPAVPSAYADSKFVFLANTHPAVQRGMLEQLPRRTLTVADTMDLWINIAKDDLVALLKQVDGLVLNYDEAELFTGKKNPVTAARRLLEYGPTFIVVKKGEHGCLFIHKDGIGALPAYPAETVVDPTGAGDTFAGGMMGYLASEAQTNAQAAEKAPFETILRSLAHGTVMASFTIESFSLDRLAELTRDQLAERYDAFARMLRVR